MEVAVTFVILHTLNGDEVAINPEQITSITRPHDGEGQKLLTDRVECAVGLSNGKFVSVLEECSEVLRRITEKMP